ncbi:MAG TPA: AbrB/MazE/SpoVT family DNA-binding domain-containing protein [Devosia sp.]|nr:AbrB/MazE/SpoVT family DNA-binding domain-containing protein [Devosia sp.]
MIATLTSKGQMTLPKAVRDDLKLKPGDRIDVVKENGQYVLRPRNKRAVDLYGILGEPPAGRGMTVEEMDEALGQALTEDDERIRAGR